MNIEYSKLKEKIFKNIKPILANGDPNYSDEQVIEAISLFIATSLQSVHPMLNGLPTHLMPALNNAFIDDMGDISSLEKIAVKLEAFLKKIMILCKGKRYTDVGEETLIALYKMLNLNVALSAQKSREYPYFSKENLDGFKGEKEYLYSLCYTKLTRNTVHDAPDWSEKEVLDRRDHILAVYVYATLLYKEELEKKVVFSSVKAASPKNRKQGMLYDFITFSKTTTSIREEIISSFILHFLKEKGETGMDELVNKTNEFFEQNVSKEIYAPIIKKLERGKQLKKEASGYQLTQNETDRIGKAQEDFTENKAAFLSGFQEITTKYGVNTNFDTLLNETQVFFENNYKIDLYEAYDKGIEIEKNGNQLIKEYIEYLKSLTPNETVAEELFKEILELCDTNDFLLRISASQIFTSLTNSNDFQNYVQQTRRIVFLDTQIILYALLYTIETELNTGYQNIYFKIVNELVLFAKRNKAIELNFSNPYIGEVSYQLKRALALIPYDVIVDSETKLSNNVFYEFYWWAKHKNFLPKEYSLAEFMDDYFQLYEEDIYNDKFRGIVNANVYDFLSDIDIQVPDMPRYSLNEIENAISVLKISNPEKKGLVQKNDAIMACHLSNKSIHLTEPIFLTWDKGFTEFRKRYVKEFNRTETLVWHLFNPAKFLNHISLLKMKINPQAFTNEFLSIMGSVSFQEQVGTIYDVQSKFIELSSSDKKVARKNTKILKKVFENEFENVVSNTEDKEEEVLKIRNALDNTISRLIDYLQRSDTELTLLDYKRVMKKEALFTDFSNIVFSEIKDDYDSVKLDNLISFIKENK